MSTVDLPDGGIDRPAPSLEARPAAAVSHSSAPIALAAALLLVVLYAAFEHGAVQQSAAARIQVAVAAITACAAAWVWTGTVRVVAPRLALTGLALLSAFAVWSGITLAWSVAPDQTWLELNRGLGYLLVLAVAVAVGASIPRSIEFVAKGYLLVALAVTAYALGQKLVPGLHVSGVFDLNQTGPLPRLQEPLGYWNALALVIVIAVPVALVLAIDSAQPVHTRLGPLVASVVMMLRSHSPTLAAAWLRSTSR